MLDKLKDAIKKDEKKKNEEKLIMERFKENLNARDKVLKEQDRMTFLINANIFYENEMTIKGSLVLIGEEILMLPEDTYKTLLEGIDPDVREKYVDVIDCEGRLIIPSFIDVHVHLRDLGQSDKETFSTGTMAGALTGVTTMFDMPNKSPPTITTDLLEKCIEKAEGNIYADVGFIAGVPEGVHPEEMRLMVESGAIGFKIYTPKSLNGVDWTDEENLMRLLYASAEFQVPIFIHADYPMHVTESKEIMDEYDQEAYMRGEILELHDQLHPIKNEVKFINLVLNTYEKFTKEYVTFFNYDYYTPIIHFCHVSSEESYVLIRKFIHKHPKYRVSFEVTPHHLLLSNQMKLSNQNHGKVLPPLRDPVNPEFLMKQLMWGNIPIIASDHAPHEKEKKELDYMNAPSGFPSLDAYPLILLSMALRSRLFKMIYRAETEKFEGEHKRRYDSLDLKILVKVLSENPAKMFNLKKKGMIKNGYLADLMIIDYDVPEYNIDSSRFHSKSKLSTYESFKSTIKVWKVFLRGKEISNENPLPVGKVLKTTVIDGDKYERKEIT